MGISVGIDLGTTYSAVATFDKATGTVKILKNDIGEDCTPSVVCIEDGEVTIGQAAKDLQAAGNVNTAAFYKSMMGEPNFSCYIDGQSFSAENLSAAFLRGLKQAVEEANGVTIDSAVITVPAYFNEAQRQATLRAGEAAGMRVLKLINEPTSAIIAYGLTGQGEKNVMVYDLGGGTFDVTIAHIRGANVDVLATNGNHQLGGKDWDAVIVEEVASRFYDQFGVNVRDYEDVMNELAVKCEKTKKVLTNVPVTQISVQCEGFYGKYDISREFFEERTQTQLAETTLLIQKCFDEISRQSGKSFGWTSLDEVVLVGGSTRMPQISKMITEAFGRPPIIIGNKVDTIVASGAAMQASICNEGSITLSAASGFVRNTNTAPGAPAPTLTICGDAIKDVTSHSLGMLAFLEEKSLDLINSIIIPKNSAIGEAQGRWYKSHADKICVHVLQGESDNPYDCTFLYSFTITGLKAGQENRVQVFFLYNPSGMVEVSAQDEMGRDLPVKKEQGAGLALSAGRSLDQIIAEVRREKEEAMRRPPLDVTFVVDTSGSMEGRPLDEAKKSIQEFLAQLDQTDAKISILKFSDSCDWKCYQTEISKRPFIQKAIQSLEVDGGTTATPLGDFAKKQGFHKIDGKILVVLTDGEWEHQGFEIMSAQSLKKKGVIIYAVGIGDADFDFLSKIASNGGAKKIDLSSLADTFRAIASSIATQS
ncbi:MAG: Hsp70 family protein [Clostridia bacterium]|nr:Hsp70 family protein [Clostridia bacterium]